MSFEVALISLLSLLTTALAHLLKLSIIVRWAQASLPLFFFSFVWSICATVGAEGRKRIELLVRPKAADNSFEEHLPPKDMTMYDYCFDQVRNS